VAVAVGAAWLLSGADGGGVRYETAEARTGDLTVTVSATGNLEPTNQVDVGSELSGIVESVAVDDNDTVKVGQVLARLDTSLLKAEVLRARAALAAAEARVAQAAATVTEADNALARLRRVRELSGGQVPSRNEMDTAEATLARARADLTAAEAQAGEARAALDVDQTNLAKSVIYSPINGVVLSRQVEPGQTVAASLQAPVLFTLAEDLTQMELPVDVDEADVGRVRAGQSATFTVDAYPERSFPARITRVSYGSQIVDGVVTYEAVLGVDNADLSLRPGMTATAEIVVEQVAGALLVPNAALRFAPVETGASARSGGSLLGKLFPRPPRRGRNGQRAAGGEGGRRVWTLVDGRPQAVAVTTGVTDGTLTEVRSGDIAPGTAVVVGAVTVAQ
jgi:HlyD family secretion protein